jgi:transposase
MRKIEEILRLKHGVRLTHREIAQSCGVSAATVSEYVSRAKAAGLGWPLPEGLNGEELEERLFPDYAAAAGGYSGRKIAQPDWAAIHQELRRKSVTLSLLWVEYRQAHPDGYGYSQFCHRYRQWAKQLNPTMRQKHRAGEKLFIDYAGQTIPVVDPETGEVGQAQIFVAVLGASSYTYAEAHTSQSLPNWIGGHVRALAFLGGVPEVLVPDNLKAGVKCPHLYEPDINPTYQEFAQHYGVAVVPTRTRKPKDKAKAEVAVQVVERWILARLRDRTFFSLAELNQAIGELLEELNERPMRHLEKSRQALFTELDQPELAPLPAHPYEFAHWKKVRVDIDYHVAFDKHHYSVPHTLIGKEVEVRTTEKTIEIFYHRQRQASHSRVDAPGRYSTHREHMPPAHQAVDDWSPEYFLRRAEEIGPQTRQLIAAVLDGQRHPQQAYRTCLGILGLVKHYGPPRLEAACRRALAVGIRSYKGIHNILKNKLDQLEVEQPPVGGPLDPLAAHANIRGKSYYQ